MRGSSTRAPRPWYAAPPCAPARHGRAPAELAVWPALRALPPSRHTADIPPDSSGASPMKTQGANKDVVFLSGVRTGFGTFGGSLKDHSATDLGAIAARCALER